MRALNGEFRMVSRDHSTNTWDRKSKYDSSWPVVDSNQTKAMLNYHKQVCLALCMVSWNRSEATKKNLEALKKEAKREKGIKVIQGKTNKGSAYARNQLIKESVKLNSEYTFFVDCDITVIPGSIGEMYKWLRANADKAFCIGPDCYRYVDRLSKSTKWLPKMEHLDFLPSPNLAMTQYGLLFTNILRKYQFDENYGPGWGMEDNDLEMSIEIGTGLKSYMLGPVLYYHDTAHGSIGILEKEGVDTDKNIRERWDYAINKWKEHPQFMAIIEDLKEGMSTTDKIVPPLTYVNPVISQVAP